MVGVGYWLVCVYWILGGSVGCVWSCVVVVGFFGGGRSCDGCCGEDGVLVLMEWDCGGGIGYDVEWMSDRIVRL